MTMEQSATFRRGKMKKLFALLWFLLFAFPANAQVLKSSTGNSLTSPVISTNMVWQGMSQGMQTTLQGFQSSTIRSNTNRTRHYSNVAFRYFRVIIPVTYSLYGTTVYDLFYPTTYSFQVGFEYPYTPATTGIGVRGAVTWGGANYKTYTYNTWTGAAYVISDVMDACALGACVNGQIPANSFFGLWTTIEAPTSAANQIPYVMNGSNSQQRYIGQTSSTSSAIVANGGSSDVALTATSITAEGTNVSGYSNIFTPAEMLIQVPAGTKSIAGLGDSICFGVGEGANTADTTNGDSMGDSYSNMGYMARWVNEVLGINFTNVACRGSDAFLYLATSQNWFARQQLLVAGNPTAIFSENGHNDISKGQTAAQMLANAKIVYAQVLNYLPGIKIVQTAITPDSTSTDNFVTTANQTAAAGWGNSSSIRGTFNDSYVRTVSSGLGNSGYCDPNPATEYSYVTQTPASETSLFNVTGSAYGYTYDGIHYDSYGAYKAATNMVCYNASGSLVTNPF